MTPFEFATAGRVIVGPGRSEHLPDLVASLGSRAFVVTGSRGDRHGVDGALFPVAGEPTVDAAVAAVAAAREHGADVVVAIGGGSVIDLAKAVAMLLANGGEPLDYLEVVGAGRPIERASAPCVAVPTTAGTGAEVTANAVLASPAHGVKASLRSPLMLPRIAMVDPLLTLTCPPGVTASSGLDALTQCLEPFVSGRANPVTDGLAREGLRRIGGALRRAYADGSYADARADIAVGSLLGGMALANAGLGAVHGFAGVVGGGFEVPHGLACAALLVPVVEANVRALRSRRPDSSALHRYRDAARLLTGRPEASIEDGIAWLRETVSRLDVPGLGSYGVGPEHVDDIVAKAARASSTRGNPIALYDDELRAALSAAV